MGEFRFLHAADIHLDSPMRGLETDPDAPAALLRGASRAAVRNLIDVAIAERVALVLIAGDLYDGDWQDCRTGLFFIEQAGRLAAYGIPLVIVAGNHDAASVITRHLRLPPSATIFPHDGCGTRVFDQLGVAIHGRSFATRAVTEDLSRHYPAPLPAFFNIGMLHTSLTGRPGHDNYAPATVEALIAKSYDYWALGHIHAREIVHEDPWIVFPGNLQGRQVRESGPKGATLVMVRDGRVMKIEHRSLDAVRWYSVEVPLGGERDLDGAMERVAFVLREAVEAAARRPIAARVRLTGATELHEELLAKAETVREGVVAAGREHGADAVWIERVTIETVSKADLHTLIGRPDVLARLNAILDELVADGGSAILGDYPERLRQRIPIPDPDGTHPLCDGGAALVKRARELVLARLAGEV
jgi:DNA repair protein SbcD/Mre11